MWLAIFFPEIYAKQTVGTFYYNQKNSHNTSKIGYKITKNTTKIRIVPILAMTLQWLCSGLRVHHKYRNKTEKIIKTKAESWYISDCSWWDGWWWSHDQFANRVKKECEKSCCFMLPSKGGEAMFRVHCCLNIETSWKMTWKSEQL